MAGAEPNNQGEVHYLPHPHSNRACDLLGCRVPVVLAGMGGPSRSELVAAVSDAGGFGFLGMVREPAALIVQEVETLRQRGYHQFGVNIIPAATPPKLLSQQLETIIELHVPVVALFWDIDSRSVARLRDSDIVVVYQVGSVDEAKGAQAAGADIVIAQGREAGGHVRGTTPLRELLPAVAKALDVPVLAAGGLATAGDLLTATALGAEGIVLGTALLASKESFAHAHHKQRLLNARASDTLLTNVFHINWPPGAAVRVLASAVTSASPAPEPDGAATVIGEEEGRPIYLHSTDSPLHSMTGDFESMALYAGTGVGSVNSIRSASEIVAEIVAGAQVEPIARQLAAEASSPVCYIGEVRGAYAGELDPEETTQEIAILLADLRALLAAVLAQAATHGSPDSPPFSEEAEPVARWIARLSTMFEPRAGKPMPPDEPRRSSRDALRRLGTLIPRLPDNELRATLVALREWLETSRSLPRPDAATGPATA